MKHKATNDFTEEEKTWMNTVAINYILAQSDGFQLGYGQALSDLTENIIDYWKVSDDEPQQSILDLLVDLGGELRKKKEVVEKNIEGVKAKGYEQYYNWQYKDKDIPFGRVINLYTKMEVNADAEKEES